MIEIMARTLWAKGPWNEYADAEIAAAACRDALISTLPEDDRELVKRLEWESNRIFPKGMRDGFAHHSTAFALDKARDRILAYHARVDELENVARRIDEAARGGADTVALLVELNSIAREARAALSPAALNPQK